MISALLWKTFKQNWKLLLIFFLILSMYMSIIISMYDPEDMAAMLAMLDLMPKELMDAMGFSSEITDLTSYIASWLYGLLMIGFPLVYSVILGNRLVAKMVDDTSFTFLLSTPNSRVKIILTQGLYGIFSLIILFILLFVLGTFLSDTMFPDLLNVRNFAIINLYTLLVNLVVFAICFFFSSLLNDSRRALGLGTAIPLISLLLNMLGNTSSDLAALKQFSIFGWYNPIELAHNRENWWILLFYTLTIVTLFLSALLVFRKKQLPL